MSRHWGVLHDRAARIAGAGDLNANTRNRYVYNTFGIRRILNHLEERDIVGARILLVTAYETPIQELLDSPRVDHVLAIDLSHRAGEVVAEKYSQHPQAQKLSLKVADYANLKPEFQEIWIDRLTKSLAEDPNGQLRQFTRYMTEIGHGKELIANCFADDAFDAVHLPFVTGSLHLGPVTVAIQLDQKYRGGQQGDDYGQFLDQQGFRTPAARAAALASMNFALAETRRIVATDGIIIINTWARPQPDLPGYIRMSDTPFPPEAVTQLFHGYERVFSGHPQPTLPHTVGHILEAAE